MTEKMKPPARRKPAGRVLGGGKATGTTPPPPSAELTRDQILAEEAAGDFADAPSIAAGSARTPEPAQEVDNPTGSSPSAAVQEVAATPHETPPTSTAEQVSRDSILPVQFTSSFPASEKDPRSGEHERGSTDDAGAPSTSQVWIRGSGRPKDIPETAVILNQRTIRRENLDGSVPAALRLKKRIKRLMLDNDLDHLPLGDIIAVGLDEWLTNRGF